MILVTSVRIDFILMWIRIRGSTPGNSGSGSEKNVNDVFFFVISELIIHV